VISPIGVCSKGQFGQRENSEPYHLTQRIWTRECNGHFSSNFWFRLFAGYWENLEQ